MVIERIRTKPPSRPERVAMALLIHYQGISGREIDAFCELNSGKNEVGDFINDHGILIHKQNVENVNEFGKGFYTVYSVPDKQQARKLINLVNGLRKKRNAPPLTQTETQHYLSRFKGDL